MNVVADRGAVGRIIVFAEHGEIRHVTLQRHHRAGNEMSFVIAQLADLARYVGAAGVEIAQAERTKPVGVAIVGEHPLDHPFRGAVGIDRCASIALWQRLAVGVAIDRAG